MSPVCERDCSKTPLPPHTPFSHLSFPSPASRPCAGAFWPSSPAVVTISKPSFFHPISFENSLVVKARPASGIARSSQPLYLSNIEAPLRRLLTLLYRSMLHDSRPVGCFERIKAQFRREKSPARTVQASPASGYATCNSILAQSLTERQSSSPTLPSDPQPSASTNPSDADASDRAACPSSLRERLWNRAYDQARKGDRQTVDGYERILSAQLSQEDADFLNPPHTDSTDNTTPRNEIEQDVEKRKKQMRQLVQKGLQKIEKETNTKQDVKSVIDVAMVFKEVVDKAVQASHEAALAWVGVCTGLQVGTLVVGAGI